MGAAQEILTVGQLTGAVRALLEEGFPHVWVTGEVSNLAKPPSGHLYFTLKDADAQIRSVMWRSAATRLRFRLEDGMKIVAAGRLSVYPARGDYQLVIDQLQPKGLGALELAFRQLRDKLAGLGYFAPERKRPLPAFPKRVCLVTSPSGAAVRDMLEIFGRRWPACEIWICPVRVQGEGAARQIAAGIRFVNRLAEHGTPFDAMIVGRGGGSLEDLWAFNEEIVAQAIFQSAIPVVSAVGHEIDLTIADLVADRRALTPSEAAETVVPNRADLVLLLRRHGERIASALERRVSSLRQRLDLLATSRILQQPLERVRDAERLLTGWRDRLERAMDRRTKSVRDDLASRAARLENLSPLNVLARGYSVTRKEADGSVVQSAKQVQVGDRIVTLLREGSIISRVETEGPPG